MSNQRTRHPERHDGRQPHHDRRRSQRRLAALGVATASILVLSGCGSDRADSSSTAGSASTTTPASTGDEDLTAYCAVATELDQSEAFPPTADVMTRYIAAAPPAISTEVAAVQQLIPVAGDATAFFVHLADDSVEQGLAGLDAYEADHCGLPRDTPPPEGSTRELETAATRIDVTASDYAFTAPATAAAGRSSMVLVNEGKEAHFLELVKLKPGVTLDEVMSAEDPSTVTEGDWESGVAAPGGADEEVVTLDLTPGVYALFCWIPGPGGQPHAMMGMHAEIVVS